jgi:hypothetical protein
LSVGITEEVFAPLEKEERQIIAYLSDNSHITTDCRANYQPMTAHWGIEDPAAEHGTDIQKETA